jgi:hypothetical protein
LKRKSICKNLIHKIKNKKIVETKRDDHGWYFDLTIAVAKRRRGAKRRRSGGCCWQHGL